MTEESTSGSTPQSATPVPVARALLDEGLRCEKMGLMDEALELYVRAHQEASTPALTSEALRRQSHAYRARCDWDDALRCAREGAEAALRADSPDLVAEALNAEAAVHQTRSDFEPAAAIYEKVLEVGPSVRIRGVVLQNLAGVRAMQGHFDEAEHHLSDALHCFERAGYAWGRAHVLNNLGRLALDRRDFERAEALLAEAEAEAKRVDDHELIAITRINHAEALLERGDLDRAEQTASAAVGHLTSAGNQWRRIECFRLLGDLYLRRDMQETARRFFTSALRVAEELGAPAEAEQLRKRLASLEGK